VTGTKLINKFLEGTPALVALRNKVKKFAEKGSLPGLDGRRLYVRSPHKALNTLLQGGGAVVMKVALVMLSTSLKDNDIPHKFVINCHDEWQIETPTKYAKVVAEFGVSAIKDAGVALQLRCPMSGESKIGASWLETH